MAWTGIGKSYARHVDEAIMGLEHAMHRASLVSDEFGKNIALIDTNIDGALSSLPSWWSQRGRDEKLEAAKYIALNIAPWGLWDGLRVRDPPLAVDSEWADSAGVARAHRDIVLLIDALRQRLLDFLKSEPGLSLNVSDPGINTIQNDAKMRGYWDAHSVKDLRRRLYRWQAFSRDAGMSFAHIVRAQDALRRTMESSLSEMRRWKTVANGLQRLADEMDSAVDGLFKGSNPRFPTMALNAHTRAFAERLRKSASQISHFKAQHAVPSVGGWPVLMKDIDGLLEDAEVSGRLIVEDCGLIEEFWRLSHDPVKNRDGIVGVWTRLKENAQRCRLPMYRQSAGRLFGARNYRLETSGVVRHQIAMDGLNKHEAHYVDYSGVTQRMIVDVVENIVRNGLRPSSGTEDVNSGGDFPAVYCWSDRVNHPFTGIESRNTAFVELDCTIYPVFSNGDECVIYCTGGKYLAIDTLRGSLILPDHLCRYSLREVMLRNPDIVFRLYQGPRNYSGVLTFKQYLHDAVSVA